MVLSSDDGICSFTNLRQRALLGDAVCNNWFNQFSAEVRSITVPRCVHKEGATRQVGFCELRAKAYKDTTIFMNHKLHSYHNHPNESQDSKIIANPEKLLFVCDESLGHKMNIVRTGGWFDFIEAECE